MPDFTSALYLSMRHAYQDLQPWRQLTTGVPLAFGETPLQRRVEAGLAQLLRSEKALLAPSTLHLFWDLFEVLAPEDTVILVDEGTYPISRWGIDRASYRGVRVEAFPHHDADALVMAGKRYRDHPILVVADGFCTGCGSRAPLADYLTVVSDLKGLLVVDDSQGLGVLGHTPSADSPLGRGGGGVVTDLPARTPQLLTVSSLGKGFGVPLAVLAGNQDWLGRFENESETRVHCSPPSIAHLQAAAHALVLNRQRGEGMRKRLLLLIRTFRHELALLGLRSIGGLFPVQTLACPTTEQARRIHRCLRRLGIHTLLRRLRCSGQAGISFVLNAGHTLRELELAIGGLNQALGMSHIYSPGETR